MRQACLHARLLAANWCMWVFGSVGGWVVHSDDGAERRQGWLSGRAHRGARLAVVSICSLSK